jgi:hypothetical protein
MGQRWVRYVLVTVLVAGGVAGGLWAQPSPPAPYPSAEVIADRGFAVWPEDTVDEAQDGCSRAGEEPWRLTPDGVVSEFAVRVMKHDDPQIDYEMSDIGDDTARIWLYPPRELATILELIKAGECWFITFIEHREETSSGFEYTFDGDTLTAYLVDARWTQLGFGTEDREKPQDEGNVLRWTFEEEISEPGHFLTVGFRDGIGTVAVADALPPPPDRDAGEMIFPPSDDPVWDRMRSEGKVRDCRYLAFAGTHAEGVINQLLEWQFARAMPSGPYPDVLHRGEDGPIGKRVERYRKSSRRWVLIVDDVRYEVRLTRVMDKCWAIETLDASNGGTVLERAWLDGDQTSVEARPLWDRLGLGLTYGSEGEFMTVRPRKGTSISDADIGGYHDTTFDRESPGVISAFVLERGRYVNAQIRRLPPRE